MDVVTDRRSSLGRRGEQAALDLYLRAGYRVLARNWRCALGEVDLVLARGPAVVVCEVKTRAGTGFGPGYEAVTRAKRRRLRRLAQAFVAQHGLQARTVRFDVASVLARPDASAEVELFQDAF